MYNLLLRLVVLFVEEKKLFVHLYKVLLRLVVLFVWVKKLLINTYNFSHRLPVLFVKEKKLFMNLYIPILAVDVILKLNTQRELLNISYRKKNNI